jgi:hypothetical protein
MAATAGHQELLLSKKIINNWMFFDIFTSLLYKIG